MRGGADRTNRTDRANGSTRRRERRERRAWTIALAAAAACLGATTAQPLSLLDHATLEIATIPLQRIELDPCPPRCEARLYAMRNPSELYRPLQPDEIVFEGEAALIWGDAPGARWLIWSARDAPTVTVWDDSMWADEDDLLVEEAPVADNSPYSVSKELQIQDPRPGRRSPRRRQAGAATALAPDAEQQLARLDEAPPEILTPTERSWLANLLDRLSKSQYAVAGVTLALITLMARLAR